MARSLTDATKITGRRPAQKGRIQVFIDEATAQRMNALREKGYALNVSNLLQIAVEQLCEQCGVEVD